MSPTFPFDVPPVDELFPTMAVPHSELGRDADVLAWFMEHRGMREVGEASPIHRWMRSLRAYAENERGLNVAGSELLQGGSRVAALCDLFSARLAAHSIRVIEGAHAHGRLAKLDVHASFVASELGARDRTEETMAAMPASFATLFAAASCARVGGDSLTLFGSDQAGGKGLDLEFVADRATLRFECKARAFADAFAAGATYESTLKHALGKIVGASKGLHARSKSDGKIALQIVHVCALVPFDFGNALQAG